MITYPILVERFKGYQSTTIVCRKCGSEELIDPDDLNESCQWDCACGGVMVFKFEEANRCPNCKKLGFYRDLPTKGCCSRVCMLQMEWAEGLKHGA